MKISKRHIAKTVTWRIIGTLDTLILAWLISGNFEAGLKISGFELITKMVLYYIHERLWFQSKMADTNKRHIIKTFTWRAVGTTDTMILSTLVTGNPLTGLKIGGSETLSKMILYYFHEKLWYKINYGLDRRK